MAGARVSPPVRHPQGGTYFTVSKRVDRKSHAETSPALQGWAGLRKDQASPAGTAVRCLARAPAAAQHADRADFNVTAQTGLDVRETLAYIRHPGWQWHADTAAAAGPATAHQGR